MPHNNEYITDFKEKAELFNLLFIKQYSLLKNENDLPVGLNYLTKKHLPNINFPSAEIAKILAKLNPNKAHRLDKITICMLETPVSTCFCQSLTTYINLLMKLLQDISKLLDKVQHRGIIFKLQKDGTFGRLLNLGTDFLKNRKQRAVPNGKSSQRADLTAGPPHGLIRCPLLSLSVPGKMKNSIFLRCQQFHKP